MSGNPESAALRSRVIACAAAVCAGALFAAGGIPTPPGEDVSAAALGAPGDAQTLTGRAMASQEAVPQADASRPTVASDPVQSDVSEPVTGDAWGTGSAGEASERGTSAGGVSSGGVSSGGADAGDVATETAPNRVSGGAADAMSASEAGQAPGQVQAGSVEAELGPVAGAETPLAGSPFAASAYGTSPFAASPLGAGARAANSAVADAVNGLAPLSGEQQTLFVGAQAEDVLPSLLEWSVVETETETADPEDSLPVVRYPFAKPVMLTDGFGYRTAPVAQFHDAQDFAAAMGTPVLAIADGKVIEAGPTSDGCGFGLRVLHEIAGKDVTSRYCHMMDDSHDLEVGDTVEIGDRVGRVGATGMAFGAHLHLAIRINNRPVDPMKFLKKYGRMTRGESEAANAKRTDEPGSHVEDVVPPPEDPRGEPTTQPPTTPPPTTEPPKTRPPTTEPPTTKPPTTEPPTTPPPTTPPPTTQPPTTAPPTTSPTTAPPTPPATASPTTPPPTADPSSSAG